MSKPKDSARFTRKETIERLQELKRYLGNKERLAFACLDKKIIPEGYRPDDDRSCYNAPRLSDLSIKSLKSDAEAVFLRGWKFEKTFQRLNAFDFVSQFFGKGAAIGEAVAVIFYPWKQENSCSSGEDVEASKFAVLWLGTWHHAPIVAWLSAISGSEPEAKVDFLPKYTDLIH